MERPNDAIDWSNTTLLVTADHSNGYIRFARTLNRGELPQESIDSESGAVSYPDGESSYSSEGQHTSELVNVYAKGFAASKLHEYEASYPGYGIMDDTATYALTLDAARR